MSSFIKTSFSLKLLQDCSSHSILVCVYVFTRGGCVTRKTWLSLYSHFLMTNSIYNTYFFKKKQFIIHFSFLKKFIFTFSEEACIWELRTIFLFILILNYFKFVLYSAPNQQTIISLKSFVLTNIQIIIYNKAVAFWILNMMFKRLRT